MDITVALGGGGTRGNAHIGVLRVLEQAGFHIRAIAGSSIGGIVAAFYAAGYTPDEIEAIFSKVDTTKLYKRDSEDGPSILGTAGIRKFLEEYLGERNFEELPIPCAMPAMDMETGNEVVFRHGLLRDALLATIAVPGIFPPHHVGDYDLVDGAVLNPVPVSLARMLAPSLPVVAVALSQPLEPPSDIYAVPLPGIIPPPILQQIYNLRVTQAFNIFLRSVDIISRTLTELRLEQDLPDVIVRPQLAEIHLLDPVNVHEIALRGEVAMLNTLPQLRRVFSWPGRLQRWLAHRNGPGSHPKALRP